MSTQEPRPKITTIKQLERAQKASSKNDEVLLRIKQRQLELDQSRKDKLKADLTSC